MLLFGILSIVSILAVLLGLIPIFEDWGILFGHIFKLLVQVVAIVILFYSGGLLWIKIVAIASAIIGFAGGVIAQACDGDSIFGFILIFAGIIGTLITGVAAFFYL